MWREGRTRSADGTLIRWYGSDPPSPDAPTVLVAGGLGGERDAWRPQFRFLGDRLRFVTWDYRGLYDGAARRRGRHGIEEQLADLGAVRAAAGGSGPLGLFGSGLGVQVALEAALRFPVSCLVLAAGPAGGALAPSHLPGGLSRRLLLGALESERGQRALGRTLERLRGRAGARWLRRLGVVGSAVELEDVEPWCDRLAQLDPGALAATLKALGSHDALGRLERLTVPALIVAGERDPLLAPAIAQQLARRIARSQVLMVPGGRHLLGLEFPELVNLRLERFFHDAGLC